MNFVNFLTLSESRKRIKEIKNQRSLIIITPILLLTIYHLNLLKVKKKYYQK